MSALTYRWVAVSDVGLRRDDNQDSGYAGPHLLALADGMGGAAAGDLASATIIRELRKLDADIYTGEDDATESLAGTVHRANSKLGDIVAENPSVEGMGTTLEAMLWDGSHLVQAHIGDSRSYRLRGGQLEQLNPDHTFVQSLIEEGRITPEEAEVHPHRALILRALLGRDDNDPDLTTFEPRAADRYLLCSDGLSDMLDVDTIAATLASPSIDLAATELVRQALENGGHDNVTVVIAEFVSADNGEYANGLACADGKPQLVGAAAKQPRPPTGREVEPGEPAGGEPAEMDPEEARYAPRPPKRFRALRWVITAIIIVALFAIGLKIGYDWTQRQYYVAEHDGHVAIYRGVSADIPGISLNHVTSTTSVRVADLPEYNRDQLAEGIKARDRRDASKIVHSLGEAGKKAGKKSGKKTPSPSDDKSTDDKSDTPSSWGPGPAVRPVSGEIVTMTDIVVDSTVRVRL